ncbi:MAG: ABC transporter permease [Rickettsiales bacterium]
MKLSDSFHEAWLSVAASRLRTFLAMLGIVIGVGSVIIMMAIGTGSQRAVEEAIEKLGTNVIIVTAGSSSNQGLRSNIISELNIKDANAIAQLPSVLHASPSTSDRNFQVSAGSNNWNARVIGMTPEYFSIRNWTFAEGGSFTDEDQRKGKRVAVIGKTVATNLFGNEFALGRTLRINGIPFHIVGITEEKGQSYSGRDEDNIVFVPITTAQSKLWGYRYVEGIVQIIFVQSLTKEVLYNAEQEITELMRERNKLRDADADNFTVRTLNSIAQTATSISQSLSLLLGTIAAISLVVGGIGIMNIMLVTVTERTREIGIRKAIGATEHNILTQFLLESIIISGVGSLIGFLTGVGLGYAAENYMGITVVFTLWSVLTALAVAIGVGLFSGLYPAFKAARMQPIEALRVN